MNLDRLYEKATVSQVSLHRPDRTTTQKDQYPSSIFRDLFAVSHGGVLGHNDLADATLSHPVKTQPPHFHFTPQTSQMVRPHPTGQLAALQLSPCQGRKALTKVRRGLVSLMDYILKISAFREHQVPLRLQQSGCQRGYTRDQLGLLNLIACILRTLYLRMK